MAGLITILSPCILSIAPILLATSAQETRYKPLGIITGLIISFSFFTLSMSAIVHATGISPDIFRFIALGTIIFFGLTMIVPWLENKFAIFTSHIARLGSTIEKHATHIRTEFISGFILGIALGLIWTPCAGTILATITAITATEGISLTTILMILSYSIGAAIPMLLITFGGAKIMQSTTKITPYIHTIRQIFGVIIIITALGIIFHVDLFIQEHIAQFFPTITIENSPLVHKELKMLKKNNQSPLEGTQAPELIGITEWINSKPLTLAELKGKVVLLDFWTYSCINCIRTLPHVTEWYKTYKDKGLEIIGIHTPEFAFEKNKQHVEDAIKRFNITYPVALDNDYQTWRAYDNHYWPAHYLINQDGIVVKTHFGEGNYVEMENAIRALLNIPPCTKTEECAFSKTITPETYLGFERGKQSYPTQPLGDDQVGLTGKWQVAADHIRSEKDGSEIILNFIANHVYLVAQSDTPQTIAVLIDGKKENSVTIHQPKMYEIIDLKDRYGRHTLTLQCPKGINAYVFTFGGPNG